MRDLTQAEQYLRWTILDLLPIGAVDKDLQYVVDFAITKNFWMAFDMELDTLNIDKNEFFETVRKRYDAKIEDLFMQESMKRKEK